VVISAVYLGRGPSLLAAIGGVLAFDFFLIPPYLTFAVSDTEYLLTFLALFVVSLVVSSLTARVREQAEAALRREAQASALYNLGRELTSALGLQEVAGIVITHVAEFFGREAAIFVPEGRLLKPLASSPGYQPDENELAVAAWAFEHDQPAGPGTDTLPAASLRCQPLRTARGRAGVLGIRPEGSGSLLTPEQRQTFDAFAHQAALAVERAGLAEQARQAELLQATEKLQTALLDSISHDLRTPLVSITGALSSLAEEEVSLDEAARRSLIETASEEADRLNRLVGNLLDMTRLEAGALQVRREPCDLQDLVGATLEEVGQRLGGRSVQVDIPADLPPLPVDFVLIGRVLTNVIDNALKYSEPDTPIEIRAHVAGAFAEIAISDRGVGIPAKDLGRVFDKFYRVQRPDNVTGTGLGLAISRGIVEAHGGFISAENRRGGGTTVTVALPLETGS
jgi:two-component system sensor histidine kinase KdpD